MGRRVAVGVKVRVGSGLGSSRVTVGGIRVRVGRRVAVFVGGSVWVTVFEGEGVNVGINSAMDSTVNAAMVFMFSMAESTISWGPMAIGVFDTLGPAIAAAETRQKRLKPTTPVARTVNGPAYARILTRDLSSSIVN